MLVKTPEAIEKMRVAGQLAASVLEMIEPYVIAGASTKELEQICRQYIVEDLKAIPSTLNHYGFPACICTSINHVVCHGIPSEKKLKNGDIINIDVTVQKDGYIGDTSKMFLVGNIKPFAKKLVEVTQECLYKAISIVRPGAHLGDIGNIIQTHAEQHGYSIVREFGGHGIGKSMWEDPHIMHFGKPNTGLRLQAGMTFTIEPMLNLGRKEVKTLGDGWTVVTKDHKLSAQWEHTILVTDNGHEILTLRADEHL
ncbi:type I methionyl aminopeptidase [Legionella pneumophila]|uniref:Methionine aminopeptidase n=1 Tax=Legionella pneumophila (strain Lens) TaxID=297245 RepID=Q5X008_LEGPL|nr:type I methionyl aminopeptidase [Legionella pneumophila]AOW53091.1 type I methionyl aminopeptidase [Legionella pneumophila subsp. pneumophila]AOW56008.1 type I methionyl aminopeptidase [Legionella pneumophila subsp. pneumophila]AOW58398.1 type I methionyl aminopeptidase [Legionella pneumophila subsp. pneumophila]AOW61420.1 type I methionyl aminopeptidase [Legionella pneumophila subsp. pneumophila]AOW63891.1 type I methionyl aminopeptidase [Legionella pneumophila subsp. pneumophila]